MMSLVHVPRDHRWLILALGGGVVAACGGGDARTPVEPALAGLRVVSGADVTDTIEAYAAGPLVVQVRDAAGAVMRGVVVRFESQLSSDTTRLTEAAIHVCRIAAKSCGGSPDPRFEAFAADTTDADGQARAQVRFGLVAARASLRITAPAVAAEVTANFTVRNGAPEQVRVTTPPVQLDIGTAAVLRSIVLDRGRNLHPEPATWSTASSDALSLDAASGTITGRALGSTYFYARSGALVDSVFASAIPVGRLLLWDGTLGKIILADINLANVRVVLQDVISSIGAYPQFDASRTRVSVLTLGAGVLVSDTAGTVRRSALPVNASGYAIAHRLLPDGSVRTVNVFRIGDAVVAGRLLDVAPDGTVTSPGTIPALNAAYGSVDISPDGSRIAYRVSTSLEGVMLRVFDLASGTSIDIAEGGAAPRWSQDGSRLAYLSRGPVPPTGSVTGAIRIVNADGTGRNPLASTIICDPGIGWSPDGRYVVAQCDNVIRVFSTANGTSVALRFAQNKYAQPDWR